VAIKAMRAMQTPLVTGPSRPTGSDPTAIRKANELAIEAAFSDGAPQEASKVLESKLTEQFAPERLNEDLKTIAFEAQLSSLNSTFNSTIDRLKHYSSVVSS
jgi:predicted nucleic acid-binding protein